MQPQNEDAGISTTLEITEVFFFSLFGLGFGQSHLRSHLISEATRISDKRNIYITHGQRCVLTLWHLVNDMTDKCRLARAAHYGQTESVSSAWKLLSVSRSLFKDVNFDVYETFSLKLFSLKDEVIEKTVPLRETLYLLSHIYHGAHGQTLLMMRTPTAHVSHLCIEHLLNRNLYPSTWRWDIFRLLIPY